MSFDPTIPQPADLLSQSQVDIQTNFAQSNAVMGIDHVNFDNSLPAGSVPADRGTHQKVTLFNVSTDPLQAFPQSQIYTKHLGIAPNRTTALYFSYKPEAALPDVVSQLFGVSSFTSGTPGSVTFSNGIIVKWGTVAGINIAGTLVNFSGAFTSAVWSLVVTPQSGSSRGVATGGPGLANFTCYSENNGTTIRYIAIGI